MFPLFQQFQSPPNWVETGRVRLSSYADIELTMYSDGEILFFDEDRNVSWGFSVSDVAKLRKALNEMKEPYVVKRAEKIEKPRVKLLSPFDMSNPPEVISHRIEDDAPVTLPKVKVILIKDAPKETPKVVPNDSYKDTYRPIPKPIKETVPVETMWGDTKVTDTPKRSPRNTTVPADRSNANKIIKDYLKENKAIKTVLPSSGLSADFKASLKAIATASNEVLNDAIQSTSNEGGIYTKLATASTETKKVEPVKDILIIDHVSMVKKVPESKKATKPSKESVPVKKVTAKVTAKTSVKAPVKKKPYKSLKAVVKELAKDFPSKIDRSVYKEGTNWGANVLVNGVKVRYLYKNRNSARKALAEHAIGEEGRIS